MFGLSIKREASEGVYIRHSIWRKYWVGDHPAWKPMGNVIR